MSAQPPKRRRGDLALVLGGAVVGFVLARSAASKGAHVRADDAPGPAEAHAAHLPAAPSPPAPEAPHARRAAPGAGASHRPGFVRRRWKRVVAFAVLALLLAAGGIAAYVYTEARAVVDELSAGEKQEVVDAVREELEEAPRWDAEARLAPVDEPQAPEAAGPPVDAEAQPAPSVGGGSGPPPVPPAPLEPGPVAAPALPETATDEEPVETVAPETAVVEPAEEPAEPTTILLIGSDRRWGETSNGRSDTIILLRVDEANDLVSILSVPRDLLVPIEGYGELKINNAYSLGGSALLAATVRDYFGLRLDHFFEVTFDGFGDLVTQIGGVLLPVDQRYYVPPGAGHMAIDLEPGYQRLSRDDALSFVRFRHYDSDFHRTARQQVFLREVKRQIRESRYDFVKMRNLIRTFAKASASDIDSVGELWGLANAVIRVPPDRVTRVTLDAYGGGTADNAYLVATQEQLDEALTAFLFPRRQVKAQIEATRELERPPVARPPVEDASIEDGAPVEPEEPLLVDDGGVGAALIEPVRPGMRRCAPTGLPSGFRWPSDAVRGYELEGHPAVAAYATAGSGESILLTQTTWADPPILSSPSRTITRGKREYQIWYESGQARQIAWRIGPTRAWVTNTLENSLTVWQLLALAQSCERV